MRKVFASVALGAALTSCGVFTNPQTTPAPPSIPASSEHGLLIIMQDFDAYAGRAVDMRYVGGDGTVLMVARRERLDSGDYRLELASVPKKPDSYVDILIDLDGDGV